MRTVFLLALVSLCAAIHVQRFDDYAVLRLHLNNTHSAIVDQLNSMHRDAVSFWSHSDIQVSPSAYGEISRWLGEQDVPFTVLIQNVQELVDRERAHSAAVREREAKGLPRVNPVAADPFFDDYRTNQEISQWLNNISITYPTLVDIKVINNSYEGRPLRVVRITSPVGTPNTKPVIIWEGGIHAREWIAHATMLYMISKLVTGYGVDPTTTSILDKLEIHIAPVVNPDGYEYTWTTDRMWRKTRSPNPRSPCVGTDPNRNWADHWCEVGASTQPCSDSYCGSRSFSEVEVLSMANYVASLNAGGRVLEFIDYHSYGQLYMAPYGWSPAPPPDAADQAKLGNLAVQAILSVYGTVFEYGQIYTIIYPASGSSADWGYTEAGVKYCYGIELRDTGEYGFLLPADQIVPQGEEIWASLVQTTQYFLGQ